MPVIVAGRSGAIWGLSEVSGMILQQTETESSIEENPSKNANGEVAMTSFFNPTRTVEIGGVYTGISASVGSPISIGSVLLLGSPSGGMYCTSVRTGGQCDGFVGVHIRAKQYQLI